MTDFVRCLYCPAPAAVTITSELRGVLAHWPACEQHVERAAAQMRSERGRERAGLDAFAGEADRPIRAPLPGSIDAE